MKEVVKKEVLKLLDEGMIYPISDSSWVSPQVIAAYGGHHSVERTAAKILQNGFW